MTPVFTQKKLSAEERVGERLRQARASKNLSLITVASKTGIRLEYLLALENENYDVLPKGLYGKNFLKEYALFLGIYSEELFKKTPWSLNNTIDNPFSKKIPRASNFLVFPKIVKNFLIILIISACFLYLSIYLFNTLRAPKLIVWQPDQDIIINQSYYIISGQTDERAEVTINGQPVLSNEQGEFSMSINLRPGLNEIIISAEKRHSRPRIIQRQILVEQLANF